MPASLKTVTFNLLLASLLVFAPIKATLVTVMLFTLLDLITGVLAAHKRKEAITSSGFKRTVIKLLVYLGVVMLGYLTEQYLTGDIMPVVKILAGLVGLTELKSILENTEELTGIPLLQVIIDKLSQQEKQ
jgi:phage-related holin